MASTVDALTFDCVDPGKLADFWSAVLGYELRERDEDSALIAAAEGGEWPMLFFIVPEGKTVKNRQHLDLTPPESMAAEVERLKELGATVHRFVEEDDSFWTVMLDPEGNEFCVLRGPRDREAAHG